MSKLKDTDFLYISARLRSLEPRLLGRERMERMLEARTDEDAFRVLAECGYPSTEEPSISFLYTALAQARAETFAELAERSPSPDIVDVFRIKYDYHNLKALIKCAKSGKNPDNMLLSAGRYSPDTVKGAVLQGETGKISDTMAAALSQGTEVLSASGDPQRSDFLIDQFCYREMLETAKNSGSTFLTDYVRLQIDAANLKAVVRAYRMKKNQEFLKRALLPGGTVSQESILACYQSGGSLTGVFFGELSGAAALGDETKKGGRQTEFERTLDNALTAYLRKARLTAFGDTVLVSFLAAKEREIDAARMILSGRLSGVPADSIRERLRESDV